MTPGERVRELRESQGISQRDLEDRSGVSRRKIQRIEDGETPPDYTAVITKIASALSVPAQKLLRDPGGDFELMIRSCDLTQRGQYLLLHQCQRLGIACRFLAKQYPEYAPERLAAETGVPARETRLLLAPQSSTDISEASVKRLTQFLSEKAGVPRAWVEFGWFPHESSIRSDAWTLPISIQAQPSR